MGDIFVMGNHWNINHRQPIQPLKGFIYTRNFRFACIAWSAVGVVLASTAFCEFDSTDSDRLFHIYHNVNGLLLNGQNQEQVQIQIRDSIDSDVVPLLQTIAIGGGSESNSWRYLLENLHRNFSQTEANYYTPNGLLDNTYSITFSGYLGGWGDSVSTYKNILPENRKYSDGVLGRLGESSYTLRSITNEMQKTLYAYDSVHNEFVPIADIALDQLDLLSDIYDYLSQINTNFNFTATNLTANVTNVISITNIVEIADLSQFLQDILLKTTTIDEGVSAIANVQTNVVNSGISNIVDALYIDEDGFGELGKPIVEYVKGVHEDLVSTKGKNGQEETVGDMLYDIKKLDHQFYTNFFSLYAAPLNSNYSNLVSMFTALDNPDLGNNQARYGIITYLASQYFDGIPVGNQNWYSKHMSSANLAGATNIYSEYWADSPSQFYNRPERTHAFLNAILNTPSPDGILIDGANKFKAYNTFELTKLFRSRWMGVNAGEMDLTDSLIELGGTTNHVTSIPNYGVSTNDLDELDLIDIPDTANVNYKTQLERIADGDEETDTGEDVLDSFEDITFAIEDLGESIKEFKDGDSTYGLTYRVQLPAWEGEVDEMYLDFSLPETAKSKIDSYWRIVEYLVKMSVFAWAVLQMWSFLADKPNNLDEPIIFN